MKANEWLTNDDFLKDVIFHDNYYFRSLCLKLHNFIMNVPIPVITSWSYKNANIYFIVGKNKKAFTVSTEIAYSDYIYQVENWLKQFYPQYEIKKNIKVNLSQDEILEKVEKENISFEKALKIKKEHSYYERGIIERIFFKGNPEDTFRLNINNELSIRMSGNINKVYILSDFLKDFHKLKDEEDKRNFILDNSVEIRKIEKNNNIIPIKRVGMQMINFIKIRIEDLKEFEFTNIERNKWRWYNFLLYFETDILENDALEILENNGVIISRNV